MPDYREKVISLWVKRQERLREADEERLIWICACGCRSYYLYRDHGLRCCRCDRQADVPDRQ
jgi:hypothetical protein